VAVAAGGVIGGAQWPVGINGGVMAAAWRNGVAIGGCGRIGWRNEMAKAIWRMASAWRNRRRVAAWRGAAYGAALA